jgi:hypothetical protein
VNSPGTDSRGSGTAFRSVAPAEALPQRTDAGRYVRRTFIALTVLATIAYYFWTAMIPPGGPPRIHGEESDHFNLLSRGFQKRHLYLDREVPAALLNAGNPYDPVSRGNVTILHDASFFQGKYYIYFGPAPVVTLLLPFSVIRCRMGCGFFRALVTSRWSEYFFASNVGIIHARASRRFSPV